MSKDKLYGSKTIEEWVVRFMIFLLIVFAVPAVLYGVVKLLLYISSNSSLELYEATTIFGSAILAVIGFVLFYMRVKAMDKSAEASLQENQQTLFNTAIGHLGDDKESVRLGGIYALYELAKGDTTKDKYREPVHEILCAHIRSKTNEEEYKRQYVYIDPESKPEPKPSTEIQNLLDILTKEPECHPFRGLRVNFSGAQLQFAYLGGAQLKSANLIRAQLQSANLDKAQLEFADLRYARLQKADLRYAQMQSAILDGAQLQGATLEGIQLAGATSAESLVRLPHSFEYRMRDRIGKPPELDNVTFNDGIDRQNEWKGQIYTAEQADEWIKEFEGRIKEPERRIKEPEGRIEKSEERIKEAIKTIFDIGKE